MTIRFLDPTLINQIAAGEVIERPASAIKELVENAIDAGAKKIDVVVRDGGRTFISVTDDGFGMRSDELNLAVERHATSKIPDADLFNIRTLGFRGEALPSIGAVSRMTLTSRTKDADTAWQLSVEGGEKSAPMPVSALHGTRIEIRDLFYATPARLKFLKSATTELNHITEILQRLALVNHDIQFSLKDHERQIFRYDIGDRLSAIMGNDFTKNACDVSGERETLYLKGAISLPTYNRSSASEQYLFVNGRPVKDKLLAAAVRIAYQDYLAPNRHPALALFLDVAPEDVDINVHPAKAEVRFRDASLVRNFMISALKHTLAQAADRTATTLADEAIARFQPSDFQPSTGPATAFAPQFSPESRVSGVATGLSLPSARQIGKDYGGNRYAGAPAQSQRLPFGAKPIDTTGTYLSEITPHYTHTPPVSAENYSESFERSHLETSAKNTQHDNAQGEKTYRLGLAKAQIDGTYILSETSEGLVIVDQHAAHERLVYEDLKNQLATSAVKRQVLLIPEIITLSASEIAALERHQSILQEYGLNLSFFAGHQIIVREIPALLGQLSVQELLQTIAGELAEHGEPLSLKETLNEILATYACHHSIRSGRKLSLAEMDMLLRQMEATPYSGQCNHGRPTYIELKKHDIEKLFGRR